LLGACLVAPITGTALARVVVRHMREDWALLRGRAPAAPAARPAGAPLALDGERRTLIDQLTDARRAFLPTRRTTLVSTFKTIAVTRTLLLGVAVAMIGISCAAIAFNPVLGVPLLILSVYATRQAYANWRLAWNNYEASKEGKPTSPMGASALGHVLFDQYKRDRDVLPVTDATPRATDAELQMKAVNRTAAVNVVSLSASIATGAVGIANVAGAMLPAVAGAVRHGIRGAGAVLVGPTETAAQYYSDYRVGQQAEATPQGVGPSQDPFNARCEQAWRSFLDAQSEAKAEYVAALAEYQARWPMLTFATPHVGQGDPLDVEPLLRWSRETRQFDQLSTWISGVAPNGRDWARHLFDDLVAIEITRNRLRSHHVVQGGAACVLTGLAYGL
jgi:hypothetical protein